MSLALRPLGARHKKSKSMRYSADIDSTLVTRSFSVLSSFQDRFVTRISTSDIGWILIRYLIFSLGCKRQSPKQVGATLSVVLDVKF